jgi:dTDP-4-dehydrorhamnose reductase
MRVLLLGGTGQVGAEIRALAVLGNVDVFAPDHAQLDLKEPTAIGRIVGAGPWDIVINAAAYADVDRAESEEALAFAINADAPSRISVETARRGIPFIHISTDYVFDGRKGSPYVETDKIGPLNTYGRSKAAGEHGVRIGNPRHIILRTSWVYSHSRKNFVKTILQLAAKQGRLKIVADQRGCPTPASDIAKACLEIAKLCVSDPEHAPYGTYHFAGAGETSRFEFARAIIRLAEKRLPKPPQLLPIPTLEYPTPAARPLDTRLDCNAVAKSFNIKLRPWYYALEETIDRLLTDKDIL